MINLDVVISFILGAWFMIMLLNFRRKGIIEVVRIDGEIHVTSAAEDLSPQIREEIITALFDEVDKIEKDTKYDLS